MTTADREPWPAGRPAGKHAATPGEHRFLVVVEPGARPVVGDRPEQVQHGAGRGVDQVAADRELDDRPVALRDRDEPG
jgi:hypothetical protein